MRKSGFTEAQIIGMIKEQEAGMPTAEVCRWHGLSPVSFYKFKPKYDRKRIKLEVNELTRGLVGEYVNVYETADGRIQVRAKGVALPHVILNPERRITHAAVTENKRLGAVLAHIKEEQDKIAQKPKVKQISSKNGYVKTG